ncbi:hypothetical protein JB92DRAFT_3106903 [Gautieria morchelliformis]|nr:hypothetical protein JB92DRAFT_3106903 [Gautieria morchelliformis]
MCRELTKEERDLAQAGYDHLENNEIINKDELQNALETSMITKEPSLSRGLFDQEVERLARDGQNVLTPPKKKSAVKKVSFTFLEGDTCGCSENIED